MVFENNNKPDIEVHRVSTVSDYWTFLRDFQKHSVFRNPRPFARLTSIGYQPAGSIFYEISMACVSNLILNDILSNERRAELSFA